MKRIVCLIFVGLMIPVLPVVSSFGVAAAENSIEATAEYEQSFALFQAGDFQRSSAALRTFVQRYPNHPQVIQAYTLLGRIFVLQQKYDDALLYLQRLPLSFRSAEARLLIGFSQVQIGEAQAGQQQLLTLLNEVFSRRDNERLLQALATAATQLDQPLQALIFYRHMLSFVDNPASIYEQVHRLLQNRLNEAELAEAAFMWNGTAIGQDARLQMARRALAGQRRQQARELLQEVLASPVTFPYWQEAEQLLGRTGVDGWLNRDSIGVVLPLSGRYASYGELVKKGLDLALKEHNKTRLPVRFIYRDSSKENVSAGQVVSNLSNKEKVMAIIGPLTGTAAADAAVRAQQELVPLLTLSQRDGLPQMGDFVFRDSLTPKLQVRALAQHAIATGHISFSVLRPENRLGEEMTRLFVDEINRLGGEIVDIVSYPEKNTDFHAQINDLLWDKYDVEIKKKEEPEEEQSVEDKKPEEELEYPLAPFHALFIPDYAERVGQLAPQLMFYGLKDVTLLGINGWNSPELISRAGRFLQQAVFVDGFFRDSTNPEVQRFVELYRQAYDGEPSILEAQAFDDAKLLLHLMDDPAIRNRDDLRQALLSYRQYPGVTSIRGFDAQGEVEKDLYLLQVKNGRIVEVKP